MTTPEPVRLNLALFLLALLLAPGLWLAMVVGFGALGEYPARFARVGVFGLLLAAPGWILVFPWLAWSAAQGGADTARFVMAGLKANLANFPLWFAIVQIFLGLGGELESLEAPGTEELGDEGELSAGAAAAFIGAAAFFLGLFFAPMLAALFAWIGRRMGAWRAE